LKLSEKCYPLLALKSPFNFIHMKKLEVGIPNLPGIAKFKEQIDGIFNRRQLTNNGPLVQELEKVWEDKFKVKHAIAVSNATMGLYLAMEALLPKGAKVIVPSFTFIASAHAITQASLNPKFIDCGGPSMMYHPSTLILDDMLNKEPGIKGVLIPNLFGTASNCEFIGSIAKRRNVKLIYDSAHGVGTSFRSTSNKPIPLGGFGDCEVFSLHATKLINGFEGGIITTNNSDLAVTLREMRNFGFQENAGVQGSSVGYGTNAKLSEIHALMALCNLEYLDEIINHNKMIFDLYVKHLPMQINVMAPIAYTYKCNYSYVPCEVGGSESSIRNRSLRDFILKYIYEKANIRARIYFKPCHLNPIYKVLENKVPNAERLAATSFCLPTGLNIDKDDVIYICAKIRESIEQFNTLSKSQGAACN